MNATRDDIDACFRLLLGREPHPEEKAGHYALAGAPLDVVVSAYLTSLEFQRRGLAHSALSARRVECENFRIYVDGNDPLIGWNVGPGYEPAVSKLVTERIQPGSSMLDIGANCGYFSLLAASLGATVYAFEPLERNVRLLAASCIANQAQRVHLFAAAASEFPGTLAIGAAYTNGVVGAMPETVDSALRAQYVSAVRIDDCIPRDVRIDLVKIDAEGHEYRALLGARETIKCSMPVILTEFAPGAIRANSGITGRQYLEWLASWGYRLSIIDQPEVHSIDAILESCRGIDHIDVIAEL